MDDVNDLTNRTHDLMQLAFDNLNKDINNNDFKNK